MALSADTVDTRDMRAGETMAFATQPDRQPDQLARDVAVIRRRLNALGMTVVELARLLGVHQSTMSTLMLGHQRIYSRWGYDRWPQHVNAELDRYEAALRAIQPHLLRAQAALLAARLPLPPTLTAALETAQLAGPVGSPAQAAQPIPRVRPRKRNRENARQHDTRIEATA